MSQSNHLRLDRAEHLDHLARKTARRAMDNADRRSRADPTCLAGVFNRVADNWRPLLVIADVAGGECSRHALAEQSNT